MRSAFAAMVLVALGCRSPGPNAPAPPSDQGAGSAAGPGGAAGAGSAADADADYVTVYQGHGRFVDMGREAASENAGCLGTPDAQAACKQVRPGARCDLAAPVSASSVRCSGAAMRPGEMAPQPAPPCECSCTDAYLKAYDEWSRRVTECANVP